jgi:hypothetical protein
VFQVFTFDNLEITDKYFFSVYRNGTFLLFCLLLVAISIVLPLDYSGLFGRLGIIVVILMTVLVWLFMTILFPFDEAKKDRNVLFVNKENQNLKIIEQVTYAGAIGSDHYDTVLIRHLMQNIRWTKPIKISHINENDWLPVTQ